MLLEEAVSNDIYVIENAKFKSSADGLINGSVIGLNRNIHSYRKRTCILAEELGHYYTTVGNILDQSNGENQKQEMRARMWAYNKLIGLGGIVRAYQGGCKDLSETADYLEVTEEFLSEALQTYKNKYGTSVLFEDYEICFVPNLEVHQKL